MENTSDQENIDPNTPYEEESDVEEVDRIVRETLTPTRAVVR